MSAGHHPEVIGRSDALLVSINDRIGALAARLSCPPAGFDIDLLPPDYLDELIALARAKAKATQEAIEEAKHGR